MSSSKRDKENSTHTEQAVAAGESRRRFLGKASSVAMTGGLVAGYGSLGLVAGRYLYPDAGADTGWVFVTRVAAIKPGESFVFRTPAGESANIARVGRSGAVDDFLALSSTCPHLGCQVHWQGGKNRFFCPCHNGVFDPSGKATAGPPAEAGQSLMKYPLKIEDGLLFIEVSLDSLATGEPCTIEKPDGPPGPGHDPCLFAIRRKA